MRKGADVEFPPEQHTIPIVFRAMLIQVCLDYPGLPDARTLTLSEIRFFYDGIRESLIERTKS